MKAKDFLKFVLEEQINLNNSQMIEIPFTNEFETQADFLERFLGCTTPLKEIEPGDYVYLWACDIDMDNIRIFEFVAKNVDLTVVNKGDFIHLFKID